MVTITPAELCDIKCDIEKAFIKVEDSYNRSNSYGKKVDMSKGNELMVYFHILKDLCFHSYQDDTYQSIMSNESIYAMHQRSLEILNDTYNER